MTDNNKIRSGSLQFYPRKRARKIVPSANWKNLKSDKIGLLGFLGYKVGMVSVRAKDETPDSMSKGKNVVIPATIIEFPSMKIFAVRFYKGNQPSKDIIVSEEKGLKLKMPKSKRNFDENIDFDDVRIIAYTNIKKVPLNKKKPDMIELALSGTKEEKIKFIKENLRKEFRVSDFFSEGLVDIKGVTKGKGTTGPIKRFGISLKAHKSEKGRRRPGSLGPWNPSRVTFRAPLAGQKGFQTRVIYNSLILLSRRISEKDINKKGGFKHYGEIKNDYLLVKGSVPGPPKRVLLLLKPLRPTKRKLKEKYSNITIIK